MHSASRSHLIRVCLRQISPKESSLTAMNEEEFKDFLLQNEDEASIRFRVAEMGIRVRKYLKFGDE